MKQKTGCDMPKDELDKTLVLKDEKFTILTCVSAAYEPIITTTIRRRGKK